MKKFGSLVNKTNGTWYLYTCLDSLNPLELFKNFQIFDLFDLKLDKAILAI